MIIRRTVLLGLLLGICCLTALAQPKPAKKPAAPKGNTSQSEINKLLEESMKESDMTKEEMEEMKKMMSGMKDKIDDYYASTSTYPDFSSNAELIPKRDQARINAIRKTPLTQADMIGYATNLYTKLMAKATPEELALIRKVLALNLSGNDLGKAALIAMHQGHPEAAMALGMKAVQADPKNPTWQNNMASMLTQYGYPEQAIPVLKKLDKELLVNSTVLNNLSQAWLALGETDSALLNATIARKLNPHHPEAETTEGVIEETKGDPEQAVEIYEESMEDGVSPMTEKMITNNNPDHTSDKLSYAKIKKTIPIHEYIRKDWIKIPLLSSSVYQHYDDKSILEGYRIMIDSLQDKLEATLEYLEKEQEKIPDSDENINELFDATLSGMSPISRPAQIVLHVVETAYRQWMLHMADDLKDLFIFKSFYAEKFEKETANLGAGDCEIYDAAANRYMHAVNERIHKVITGKADTMRRWVNAIATWMMIPAGDPKQIALGQDLTLLTTLVETYYQALTEQVTLESRCKNMKEKGPILVAQPQIPNFKCPVKVRIPSGKDWQELSSAVKDYNGNELNIPKAKNPVPNLSETYGIGETSVAQPGMEPFTRNAEGHVMPATMSAYESKILAQADHEANLRMIESLPTRSQQEHMAIMNELKKMQPWSKAKIARELLNNMIGAECNGKPGKKESTFTLKPGKFTIESFKNTEPKNPKGPAPKVKPLVPPGSKPPTYTVGKGVFTFEEAPEPEYPGSEQEEPDDGPHYVIGKGTFEFFEEPDDGPHYIIGKGTFEFFEEPADYVPEGGHVTETHHEPILPPTYTLGPGTFYIVEDPTSGVSGQGTGSETSSTSSPATDAGSMTTKSLKIATPVTSPLAQKKYKILSGQITIQSGTHNGETYMVQSARVNGTRDNDAVDTLTKTTFNIAGGALTLVPFPDEDTVTTSTTTGNTTNTNANTEKILSALAKDRPAHLGEGVEVDFADGTKLIFLNNGKVVKIASWGMIRVDRETDPGPVEYMGNLKRMDLPPDATANNKLLIQLQELKASYDKYGFQPSLSSGVQMPGTFKLRKDLFQ